MQAYGETFARVYNLRWTSFARQVAPFILDYYAATPPGQARQPVLDLCCGTGQLALHFLTAGYRVTGLDLSAPMLAYARENTAEFITAGQAQFIQGDASDFQMAERFGLVVSTFDALNHLENMEALRRCFACVYAVCDGFFIFDLNTRQGLHRWNSIYVDESSDDLIITRGIYDGQGDRAWTRISGFVRRPDGLYDRFEETAFNAAFALDAVQAALQEVGWQHVHFARFRDLAAPIADPEAESRVFIVASR